MRKQTKLLIVTLTPFVVGIILGTLIGVGIGRAIGPKGSDEQVEEAAAESTPASPTASVAVVPEPQDDPADSVADSETDAEPVAKEIIYYRKRLPYAKMFADLNEAHLEMARKVGLSKIPSTRSEVAHLPLVEIKDNQYYTIYPLRFSVPYLTRNAQKELNEIGKAFSDSLANHKLLDYKLVVTSVLRTEEDVTRLRRSGNPNAATTSAHSYGTTFDITYTRYYREDESEAFMQPFELTKVLGEVLADRKAAGKCLVKYEKLEHCFHITVCY